MSQARDVVQKIREQLDRQVRTGDQLKAELTEAFSGAAEGLLEQHSAALLALADDLRQRADDLARLLADIPRTDVQIRELLTRLQGEHESRSGTLSRNQEHLTKKVQEGFTEAMAELAAMRETLTRLEQTCQQTLEQSRQIYTALGSFARSQDLHTDSLVKLIERGFSSSKNALDEVHVKSLESQESDSAKVQGWMKAVEERLRVFEVASQRQDDTLNRMAGLTLVLLIFCALGLLVIGLKISGA